MSSPMLRMLVAPRKVMREQLDAESTHGLILFPFCMGLLTTPSAALSIAPSFPEATLWVWVICVLLSVLGYWMYVHAYGVGYAWIGSRLGGQGTAKDIRLCLAWTQVPFIYIGLVFLSVHFIFHDVLYPEINLVQLITSPVTVDTLHALTQQVSPTYYIINALILLPAFYAYMVSLKLLGEAHGFSAWKALTTKLIAVALHIPIFGIPMVLVFIVMFVALLMMGV